MLATLLAVLVGGLLGVASGGAGAGTGRDPGPFVGLGAWVDAFDYAPAFQGDAGVVTVTPDAIPDMAALGVKTLYLQAAMNDDVRAPGKIVDERLVGEFLRRAHRAGISVVAWYYPTLDDPAVDIDHVAAMADFTYRGNRFDALALDIESIQSVKDVDERNDRVVAIAKQARALVGEQPLGAIVYPAVQAEVINPALWPKFPYKRLAKQVDVWMPMTYWTNRTEASGWKDGFVYTSENIKRVRKDLGDPGALVHPIGGVADQTLTADTNGFVRAAKSHRAIGWSLYDYVTTSSSAWPRLRP